MKAGEQRTALCPLQQAYNCTVVGQEQQNTSATTERVHIILHGAAYERIPLTHHGTNMLPGVSYSSTSRLTAWMLFV
jgi:hypothetical protein